MPLASLEKLGRRSIETLRFHFNLCFLMNNVMVSPPSSSPGLTRRPRPKLSRPGDKNGDRPGKLVSRLSPSHGHARRTRSGHTQCLVGLFDGSSVQLGMKVSD